MCGWDMWPAEEKKCGIENAGTLKETRKCVFPSPAYLVFTQESFSLFALRGLIVSGKFNAPW